MMRFSRLIIAVAAGASLGAGILSAQTHGQDTHVRHGEKGAIDLQEPGQGAFAALTEIVSVLRDDPKTDWQSVNISALRDHLIDMDKLVSDTSVDEAKVEGGLEITLADSGAASRMVPAHAVVLARETGWTSRVKQHNGELIWQILGDAHQIQALGFFGLMATGDHHRQHHLLLARGQQVH